MIKKIALLALLIMLVFSIQINVIAQEKKGSGFRVSPVREELVVEKGKGSQVKIYVENLSNSKTTAQVLINDFDPAEDESGQPAVKFNNQPTTYGNSFRSIASTVEKITLEARQKTDITVKISVPKSASAGGYYGVVRFADASDPQKSNVALAASVGTLFLVTVPGNLKENMYLVELSAAKDGSTGRFFINSGQMSVVARLKNTGNIHVKPFGRVEIKKGNTVVEAYDLNNTQPRSNVLPNSIRKFEDKLKNQKWLGKYTISANLGYGTSGNLITGKTTFWVIPSWVIIVSLLALALILIVAFLIYRKFASNRVKHKVRVRR